VSFSFQHQGGSLPITLNLDETEVVRPCPTCVRIEQEGFVKVKAAAERTSGGGPAPCNHGHMVMVSWTREPDTSSDDT
jgi:hypothetical protein